MIRYIENVDISFSILIYRIVSSKKYRIFRYIALSFIQGDHLSGKPGNVREFETCQGNVRDYVNSQGIVREMFGTGCAKKVWTICSVF